MEVTNNFGINSQITMLIDMWPLRLSSLDFRCERWFCWKLDWRACILHSGKENFLNVLPMPKYFKDEITWDELDNNGRGNFMTEKYPESDMDMNDFLYQIYRESWTKSRVVWHEKCVDVPENKQWLWKVTFRQCVTGD